MNLHYKHSVISHTCKYIFLSCMPVNIPYNTVMATEETRRLNGRICFRIGINIPKANSCILGCTKHLSQFIGVPGEPEAEFALDRVRLASTSYPSLFWPISVMSGLKTPGLSGSSECFVLSKTCISPFTVLVAIKSGFWGI
jgi:hypothetical protein